MPAKASIPPAFSAMDHTALLEQFNAKDRQSYERHIQAYEKKAGPIAAERWRRLACVLLTLAPFPGKQPTKFCSSHGMQFFIPDGKYRTQVFALHGTPEGAVAVYAPDVLAKAIKTGIFAKPARGDSEGTCRLPGGEAILVDRLDGKTPNPDPVFKDMTGWNHKAIRITLPPNASDAALHAVERLCVLAASEWAASAGQAK